MMPRRLASLRTLTLLLTSVFVAALASAAPIEGQPAELDWPMHLYTEGQFIEAAKAAEMAGDANGFAFAARALLADVMVSEPGKASSKVLKQAETHAQAALELEPDHLEGHLQLAIALGLKGRRVSRWRAYLQGFAKDGKEHLDKAYELAPDNPWVLSVLGGWHLEIARRAGARTAARLYKADRGTGIDYFERALAAAPDSLPIRHQFALLLLAFDDPELRQRAELLLIDVNEIEAADFFESVSQERCLELLSALQSGDSRKIAKTAKRQTKLF